MNDERDMPDELKLLEDRKWVDDWSFCSDGGYPRAIGPSHIQFGSFNLLDLNMDLYQIISPLGYSLDLVILNQCWTHLMYQYQVGKHSQIWFLIQMILKVVNKMSMSKLFDVMYNNLLLIDRQCNRPQGLRHCELIDLVFHQCLLRVRMVLLG